MKYGAAAVVVALAMVLPAFGQHGGGHGGFAGHVGSVGHSGFAGHAGFSGSRSFSRPISGPRYSGFTRPAMPMRFRPGVPYRGLNQYRPAYRPSYGNRYGYDRDHGRRGWYGSYAYPGWTYFSPYPYVIDPGLYDWSDTDDYGSNQGATTGEYAPYPDYGEPYPESPQPPYYAQAPYPQQPYAQAPAQDTRRPAYDTGSAFAQEPLTLIFKDSRAPRTLRNYMMNTKELTDLDPQHFERIPLDEIDLAATARINRTRGVDFEVPSGTR